MFTPGFRAEGRQWPSSVERSSVRSRRTRRIPRIRGWRSSSGSSASTASRTPREGSAPGSSIDTCGGAVPPEPRRCSEQAPKHGGESNDGSTFRIPSVAVGFSAIGLPADEPLDGREARSQSRPRASLVWTTYRGAATAPRHASLARPPLTILFPRRLRPGSAPQPAGYSAPRCVRGQEQLERDFWMRSARGIDPVRHAARPRRRRGGGVATSLSHEAPDSSLWRPCERLSPSTREVSVLVHERNNVRDRGDGDQSRCRPSSSSTRRERACPSFRRRRAAELVKGVLGGLVATIGQRQLVPAYGGRATRRALAPSPRRPAAPCPARVTTSPIRFAACLAVSLGTPYPSRPAREMQDTSAPSSRKTRTASAVAQIPSAS